MTNATLIALLILLGVGGALCLWAWRTGDPADHDVTKIVVRQVARHSRAVQGEVTTRLRPAAPSLPAMERDGGQAQRLPRREDLPWNRPPGTEHGT
jgi:hypothetical protein